MLAKATAIVVAAIVLGSASTSLARDGSGPPTIDIQKTCRENANALGTMLGGEPSRNAPYRRLRRVRHMPAKPSDARYKKSPKGKAADKRYRQSAKGKAAYKRYQQSAKGKAAAARYRQSAKGRARDARYRHSEKGKAAQANASTGRRCA